MSAAGRSQIVADVRGRRRHGQSSILQAVGPQKFAPSHIAELELDARDFVSRSEDEG